MRQLSSLSDQFRSCLDAMVDGKHAIVLQGAVRCCSFCLPLVQVSHGGVADRRFFNKYYNILNVYGFGTSTGERYIALYYPLFISRGSVPKNVQFSI